MATTDLENGQGNPQDFHMVNVRRTPEGIADPNLAKVVHEEPNPEVGTGPYIHRDFLGRITKISNDIARYISPTYAKLFDLIVQATEEALKGQQGRWDRVELGGDANPLIRVAVWAVGDLKDPLPADSKERMLLGLRLLLALPAMLVLMPIPHSPGRRAHEYPVFFGRNWDYPKYPRNLLDGHPHYSDKRIVKWRRNIQEVAADYNVSGNHHLLLQPVRLMVRQENNRWKLVKTVEPGVDTKPEPYIVISYASKQFPKDQRFKLERLAENMAARENVNAYWIDYRCRARVQPELTEDVHRICDVFRGARQVYAAMPDSSLASKRLWGSRMWCLPEARRLRSCAGSLFNSC